MKSWVGRIMVTYRFCAKGANIDLRMFHFDKQSGDLFIADVGQNHWEEINWQPASSKRVLEQNGLGTCRTGQVE